MIKFEVDDIYKNKQFNSDKTGDFVFDGKIVGVFPNMINRSVPGYDLILKMTGEISKKFITNDSNCYDLGCSLLGSALSILENHSQNNLENQKKFNIICIDNSQAMIDTAKKVYENYKKNHCNKNIFVDIKLRDISEVNIQKASFSILNLVLQFVDPNKRFSLLKKIYDGTLNGGAVIITDKVNFLYDQKTENFQQEMYYSFKKLNGYSELEISKKRDALENVLITDNIEKHIQRLKEAGFSEIYKWFQCFNFVSFLAIK